MKLDSSAYGSYFTFYLGHGYVVDEQLHRYIVELAANDSTAMIHRRLNRMHYDHYFDDYQLYLTAVASDKVRPKNKS